MEDVRSPGKSSASRPESTVVRQFAGSRVERQVLAQVFDVVWHISGCPTPSLAGRENEQRSLSYDAVRLAMRVTEGVAS